MTWVWLKVGAKYDKCKYLLQKERIIKYETSAYVTIFKLNIMFILPTMRATQTNTP